MGDTVSIIGYHKAPLTKANAIVANNEFPISRNKVLIGRYMWLGDGIYFWRTFDDAQWWNKDRYHYGAILTAQITCDSKEYINLDLQEEMERFEEYSDQAILDLKARKAEVDFNNDDEIQSIICTLFKYEYGIKLMRYSFPRRFVKNSAGFFAPKGITQYCVTDMESISDIQLIAKTEWGDIVGGYYGYF